jgi:hypothetical protein
LIEHAAVRADDRLPPCCEKRRKSSHLRTSPTRWRCSSRLRRPSCPLLPGDGRSDELLRRCQWSEVLLLPPAPRADCNSFKSLAESALRHRTQCVRCAHAARWATGCESAWGSGADRRHKRLIDMDSVGSTFGAVSQPRLRNWACRTDRPCEMRTAVPVQQATEPESLLPQ